mmetsp:Transcript_99028/g.317636  ORF Transcript_99028/g.317636 Transcript_99028/m.317636 type:complete len:281 (-) Transcript_99028:793-1635(-)
MVFKVPVEIAWPVSGSMGNCEMAWAASEMDASGSRGSPCNSPEVIGAPGAGAGIGCSTKPRTIARSSAAVAAAAAEAREASQTEAPPRTSSGGAACTWASAAASSTASRAPGWGACSSGSKRAVSGSRCGKNCGCCQAPDSSSACFVLSNSLASSCRPLWHSGQPMPPQLRHFDGPRIGGSPLGGGSGGGASQLLWRRISVWPWAKRFPITSVFDVVLVACCHSDGGFGALPWASGSGTASSPAAPSICTPDGSKPQPTDAIPKVASSICATPPPAEALG